MHIQKIIIKNFRCFEHLEVNLDPDINIFVGNNGSGKSALLDGIAAAMYPYVVEIQKIVGEIQENSPVFQRDLPAKKEGGEQKTQAEFTVSSTSFPDWKMFYKKPPTENDNKRIEIDFVNSIDLITSLKSSRYERFYSAIQQQYDKLNNDPTSELFIIAYYKGDRYLTNIGDVETISNQSFNRFGALNNAFDATANFTDLATWFFVREYEELREGRNRRDINFELPDLKQVRNAISTIIAPNARVYFSGANNAKLMVEWTMETGEKRELLLSQLSAGYRNMLALVMDFARRLAQANPHMENPLAAEAILMIDELDLHLHPTWQQNIIPDFKKVFPNTQIIATTHSPEVVTTVKQNQVKILEDYQIKECPSPTKGMKSSDIVRYVLGLSDLRPDTEESRTLTQLFEAIDNGQLEEAKRLKKELQHWESFDPDMTRADMQIRRLERRNAV
ncbi:DNA replication and repair protein RecF [Dolichospermum sp. UHCC 0315A]|uniref:AAA family ATPase n=1 Tax=Dolichospermum sp. UHCC 0315A TaxID=1914871 RepID=UPI0011E6F441|nr:AAA family ATPase [Dolichospermum sp. UHCC 0315A]QEI39637.1 DNA replication and repair protein RecF [Dolichospermum sp. UHCC 0315A]